MQAKLAEARVACDRIRAELENRLPTSKRSLVRVPRPDARGGMALVSAEFDAEYGLFIEPVPFLDADDLPARLPATVSEGWGVLGDADPSMPIRGRDPEADSGNVLPLPAAS